jgi:hypothetical protein
MRFSITLFVVVSVMTIFLSSSILQLQPSFAQPSNANTEKVNTTDIDSAIVNMLNKISRGNIIDSTMNSIISGMNVEPNEDQNPNNQVQPSSLSDINSIISSTTNPDNSNTQSKQDVSNNINKFILKVVNKENNDETIIKSNSLTEFNNELINFCTTSSNIFSFECISSMQNSIEAADFTSNYMGPTKLITNLDKYKLDLTVR